MDSSLKEKLVKLAETVANLGRVIENSTVASESSTTEEVVDKTEKTEEVVTAEAKVEETVAEVTTEVVVTEEAEAAAKCPECGAPMDANKTCAKCGGKSKAEVAETTETVVEAAPVVEAVAETTEVVAPVAAEAAVVAQSKNTEQSTEQYSYKNEKGQTVVVTTITNETVESVTDSTVVAEQAAAAKVTKKDGLKKAMCAEDLEGLDFTETELALATKFSYVELVKFAAESSREVASFREAKAKAEADIALAARIGRLSEAEILFAGEKGEAQKKEVAGMTEEAFASYVTKMQDLKGIFVSEAGLDKTAIGAAKASVGKLSVEVTLAPKKLDYSKI